MDVLARKEGYLSANGYNGQVNRLYYSVPKDQMATQNALFFVGDHVDGNGDALIERLNTGEGIAATLLPKLAPWSNLFIVYPSHYKDGVWACYESLHPKITPTGEPEGFDGREPVAGRQLAALIEDALHQLSGSGQPESSMHVAASLEGQVQGSDSEQAAEPSNGLQAGVESEVRSKTGSEARPAEERRNSADRATQAGTIRAASSREQLESRKRPLPTFVTGFSKGGVVLNEILAELAALEDSRGASALSGAEAPQQGASAEAGQSSKGSSLSSRAVDFLDSITEVHYIDVGLIRPGAYLTDHEKLSSVTRRGIRTPLTLGLHGTPRQWAEKKRPFIGEEKDRMFEVLQAAVKELGGQVDGFHVFQRGYCEGGTVGMRMHFEIIDLLDFARPQCT